MQRVPADELRAEVGAAGLTPNELARRLGWRRSDKPGWDSARVARVLGLKSYDASRGYGTTTRAGVNADTARRVRRALVDAETHGGVIHLWHPAAATALCGFSEDRHPEIRDPHRDLIDCGECFRRAGLT